VALKILVVGPDKIFSIENFYVRYLRELGVEVTNYPSQNIFYEYYRKTLFNKIFYRAGMSGIYGRINRGLLQLVESQRPDAIWIFKGMEIFPETLIHLRKSGIKLINYNPDNPFIFSGRGSGNENITKSIELYDLHFSYNTSVIRKLEKDYAAKTALLPFGFDLPDSLFDSCQLVPEIPAVCFIGNPDSERSAFIDRIAGAGVPVTVFGHGWNRSLKNRKIDIREAVYGEQQWMALRQYRVQLNLMRPHNTDSHNMRTFEIPGVAGIMLAPATPEHTSFFENRSEAFFFRSFNDCIDQIKNILVLPQSAAGDVRRAARARSLSSGYTYKDRAALALNGISKLFV
jgi:spore maturation protein CgeB